MAPRRPHQAPRPLHPGPTATSSCVSAEPHHNTADSALRMNISTWISGLSAHKMDRRHFVAHKMDPLAMSRGHEPRFARGADAASSLRAASGRNDPGRSREVMTHHALQQTSHAESFTAQTDCFLATASQRSASGLRDKVEHSRGGVVAEYCMSVPEIA
eukprot:2996974-Rhodomonas_salina.3